MPSASKKRSAEEQLFWSRCWRKALENMPRIRGKRAPSRIVLARLLGYKDGFHGGIPRNIDDTYGRENPNAKVYSMAGQHIGDHIRWGTKPRKERAALLKILAGPYGKTISRAMLIRLGDDITNYHWE